MIQVFMVKSFLTVDRAYKEDKADFYHVQEVMPKKFSF